MLVRMANIRGGAMNRWLRSAALTVAIGVLAAGCGGDDSSGGGGGGDAGKPVTLKIGLIPIADVAPVFLGQKKGFFKEQKITLKPQFAAGGAAITPAVISGDFDIGFSNTVSLLIAGSKKLPVQIIAPGVFGDSTKEKVWEDLLVKKDGPIKQAKDLEGKTIAVNTLNNICGVTINASLEKQGVDISKLKYTEIPFPEMNAALEKGRVQGACVVEPFVSQGKASGMKGIDPFYFNTAPDLTVAAYFASKEYIAKNKDVVDRFVTAMKKSLEYSQAHPDEVRGVLTEYTQIPDAAAQKINLPQWKSDLTTDTIEQLSTLSKKYGYLEEEPDLNALIRQE
jgi:NitT/TauT family transport system substrate-binding protein